MSFSNASDISLFTFHSQIRYPDRTKFRAISFPCFLQNVQQVVRQLYLLNCLQILKIRINKTELNKEKKGKHSGITVCSDSYKNEKNLNI